MNAVGVALWRSAVPALEGLRERAVALLEPVEQARHLGAAWQSRLPPGARYVATASSLALEVIDPSVEQVRGHLATSGVLDAVETSLGGAVQVALDHAWIRRQFPARLAPPFHHAHGWHQDGALGFPFANVQEEPPSTALLRMITCWIPLEPCGGNAPGLEVRIHRFGRLFSVNGLRDPLREWPGECGCPRMEPGDVLLFDGGILHRTQVTPVMTSARTSVELRFFRADDLPARIGSRWLPARGTVGS